MEDTVVVVHDRIRTQSATRIVGEHTRLEVGAEQVGALEATARHGAHIVTRTVGEHIHDEADT